MGIPGPDGDVHDIGPNGLVSVARRKQLEDLWSHELGVFGIGDADQAVGANIVHITIVYESPPYSNMGIPGPDGDVHDIGPNGLVSVAKLLVG
jgi:pyruvate/2-oxoacid:ferredoxin oxidoreductase beta subunit